MLERAAVRPPSARFYFSAPPVILDRCSATDDASRLHTYGLISFVTAPASRRTAWSPVRVATVISAHYETRGWYVFSQRPVAAEYSWTHCQMPRTPPCTQRYLRLCLSCAVVILESALKRRSLHRDIKDHFVWPGLNIFSAEDMVWCFRCYLRHCLTHILNINLLPKGAESSTEIGYRINTKSAYARFNSKNYIFLKKLQIAPISQPTFFSVLGRTKLDLGPFLSVPISFLAPIQVRRL